MKVRKYWIGVSEEGSNRPSDFDTFVVFNMDELEDAQEQISEWIVSDFEGGLDYDEDNEPD